MINPPDERALGGLLLLPPNVSDPRYNRPHATAATGAHKPAQQLQPQQQIYHPQSTYPLRRQSAITDIKAKVSKWTKVKAAFKWERANPSLNENGKSTDSGIGLSPLNTEVARYLRVPTLPVACTAGTSSADSVLSLSSGHLQCSGSGGGGGAGGAGGGAGSSNPATPGTMSLASSMDDVRMASDDFREYQRERET